MLADSGILRDSYPGTCPNGHSVDVWFDHGDQDHWCDCDVCGRHEWTVEI